MIKKKSELLNNILDFFSGYYDIEAIEDDNNPLCAKGIYHQKTEKYVLSQKAKLWSVNVHEYVYFYEWEHLDSEAYKKALQYAYEDGMTLIKPGPDHMYSYITVIMLADSAEDKAVKEAKRCRIHKDFKLSFHGWMDVRTVVVDKGKHTIHTNRMGKDLKSLFHKIMQSK